MPTGTAIEITETPTALAGGLSATSPSPVALAVESVVWALRLDALADALTPAVVAR